MASAAPEQAASLVDVLQQLELPALERLVDKLGLVRISPLRLTCRALRDLADTGVRISHRRLSVQLLPDGTASEPVAALGRWGRRGGIWLKLTPPTEAPDGVDALLPAAFTQLPEEARRRVEVVWLGSNPDLRGGDPLPAIPGSAVGALATWLPCLRELQLYGLGSDWTPGAAGEAHTALAALGTLEELELPGVPSLTGVEALAGSLRRLTLLQCDPPHHPLSLSAAAPLGQLTRLEELELIARNMDLGEGPMLRNLLRLLPPSLRVLTLNNQQWSGSLLRGLDAAFGLAGGRLVSARLGWVLSQELAALARDELLPCLGPDGRLKSLRILSLEADGWGDTDMAPALGLWRRSDQAHVEWLRVRSSGTDACSALAAVGPVDKANLVGGRFSIRVDLPRRIPPAQPAHAPLLDLPPPEEVLRMALQRLALPGPGGEGGAAGGRPESAVDEAEDDGQLLLVRGPAAAAALEETSARALKAWTQDLEQRARAVLGPALKLRGPLIEDVLLLPPASAVLIGCSKAEGAAEAVAAAVAAAAGDGSEVQRVTTPPLADDVESALVWCLGEVMSELWAASCAGEGGPSLQQRVEWALGAKAMANGLPCYDAVYGRLVSS